jgi:peptidoglycan hydrolase-like protein with peptidoglycan-binding domain
LNHIFKRSIVFLLAIVTILSLMPLTRADAAVMKHGSRGTEVRYLQQNLIGLGYL